MDIFSIWSDVYYTQNNYGDSFNYKITMVEKVGGEDNEQDIYVGKAFRMPDKDGVEININRIVSNYLNSDISEAMQWMDDGYASIDDYNIAGSVRTFKLYIEEYDNSLSEATWEWKYTWVFINDWTYEDKEFDDDVITDKDCNDIINGHYAPRMLTLTSEYNNGDGKILLNSGNDRIHYNVQTCGDYAIYYQNLKGGWNSFLIEGNVVVKDAITSHSYLKSFNNNTIQRENTIYVNEVSRLYSCTTGWLMDDESKRFVRSLGSCGNVYVHDLIRDKIIPCVITDKEFTYKTYQNQGKKMVNYTINLKESQGKIRL